MGAQIDPFQAIGVSRLAHQLKAEGRRIIHMEFGQPSTGAPKAAIAAAHRVLDADGMGYWESPELRARIAGHYAETYGVAVEPEQVVLTCGAPPAELAAIAKVCRQRGIKIISDEIYHGLSYVGPARSILEFEPDAIVINSFSKYFSMVGWRLGWLVAPRAHMHRARAFVGNLFL